VTLGRGLFGVCLKALLNGILHVSYLLKEHESNILCLVTEIKCEIPSSLLSSNTLVTNPTPDNKYKINTDVFFECSPGNKFFTEHTSVFCQADGTFDLSIPTCDPKKCGSPPDIKLGMVDTKGQTEFRVGSFVDYKCEIGHAFSSDAPNSNGRLMCQAGGVWDANLPLCELVKCPEPASINHGVVTYDTLQWLGQLEYKCNIGYELSDDDVIECFEDGQWSKGPPTCDPVRCRQPGDILFGQVIGPEDELFLYGVEVRYRCQLGYRLVGSETRRCTEDADWSGEEPVCKPISCGKPGDFEFGEIRGRDYTLNSVITYVCNEGYERQGVEERICRETGKWQNDPPTCTRVQCVAPPTIANGVYLETQFFFGDNVTYSCESNNYHLIGTPTLTCLANRQWSGPPPFCDQILCASPPTIDNADYSNPKHLELFQIGDTVQYLCRAGYELSLNSLNPRGEISCLNTGFWESNLPECLKKSCGQPPSISDGKAKFVSITFGSIATYVCDDAFLIQGSSNISCEANGRWSTVLASCLAIKCQAPDFDNKNGRVDFKELTVGSIIRYVCNEGYELLGQEVRRCQNDTSWSGTEPECSAVNCGIPDAVQYGNTEFESTLYGAKVTYFCNKGYSLVGENTRTCTSEEKWSGAAALCEIVTCDRPSRVISNGRMIGDNFTYGSVIRYECDAGYFIDGTSDSRTCLETGEWDRPIIVCTAVECPRLSIRNGQTSGEYMGYIL